MVCRSANLGPFCRLRPTREFDPQISFTDRHFRIVWILIRLPRIGIRPGRSAYGFMRTAVRTRVDIEAFKHGSIGHHGCRYILPDTIELTATPAVMTYIHQSSMLAVYVATLWICCMDSINSTIASSLLVRCLGHSA